MGLIEARNAARFDHAMSRFDQQTRVLLERIKNSDEEIMTRWSDKFMAKCSAIVERRVRQIQFCEVFLSCGTEERSRVLGRAGDLSAFAAVQKKTLEEYKERSASTRKEICFRLHKIDEIFVRRVMMPDVEMYTACLGEKMSSDPQFTEQQRRDEMTLVDDYLDKMVTIRRGQKARLCDKIHDQQVWESNKVLEELEVTDAVTLFECGLRGLGLENYCFCADVCPGSNRI